jgi:hypothetical protein
MSVIMVLRPDFDPDLDASAFELAPRRPLAGARLVVIDNGKPRAKELLSAIADGLTARYGLASYSVFSKPGASQPISSDDAAELARTGDVFLTGLGDCGGCSACSLQDALLMERAGRPATVVISEPFEGRIAAYANKLGASGYGAAVVPHPVSSRSVEQLAKVANQTVEAVALHLGASA